MHKSWTGPRAKYRAALRDYLLHGGEENLQRAYEVGRTALNRGLGVFDMARLHQAATAEPIIGAAARVKMGDKAHLVETFLLEALSPFEAAHRGFRKAWERLEQLNGELEQRNSELASTNQVLSREVQERKKAEEALRETRDHYYKLFRQATAMGENLRLLSGKVLTAQEEERKRISRELHDEIGQALTAVNVDLGLLKQRAAGNRDLKLRVAGAQRLLVRSMDSIHSFARELRPAMFDYLGPTAAFRNHLKSFTERTGIESALRSSADLSRLDGQQAIVLFRVMQEGLTNVIKHSGATRVEVVFSRSGRALCMEVRDNGRAFRVDGQHGPKWNGRLGLLGMQERVRLIGGSFDINSVPGKGTTISVRVPLGQTVAPALREASGRPGAAALRRNASARSSK